jgi:carbonic anhydrase/acetyltransferase-like protein (isoleucine patch superfamily)
MASRTVVDSVVEVDAVPGDLPELERRLQTLRQRHPGAIIERYLGAVPHIADDAFIAPGAAVVGAVELGPKASVWFGCVLRGDVNRIVIGARSNLQDGTVVHLGDDDPTVLEQDVVVGHRAVIHGCHIERGCLIGIQSTILDGARIGHGSIIGSCALVTAGTVIPPHSLVLGVPGKVVKTLSEDDEAFHTALAGKYTRLSHNYRVG